MESSDDNFLWSDASSDSNRNNMTPDITKENGDESESGYSYKKKLHKELFSNKQQNSELENNDAKKSKKRKHADIDSSYIEEPKRKYIKTEPESDLDMHKKKKKLKTSNCNNTQHDEDFLNLKVKEEMSFTEGPSPKLKAKKKKRHRKDSNENMDSFNFGESDSLLLSNSKCEISSIANISEISQLENVSYVKNDLQDKASDRTKKKKSKKKKEKYVTDEINIEDKFSAEETVVEQRLSSVCISDTMIIEKREQQNEVKHNEMFENEAQNFDEEANENNTNKTNLSKLNKGKEKNSKHSMSENVIIDNDETIISSGGISNKLTNTVSKVSDRIRFEEEVSLDLNRLNMDHKKSNLTHSAQLQNYLKRNAHLNEISPTPQSDCIILSDDEVWVLKCPRELDVTSLKDTSLVLDNKCKIKVNNQSYVGFTENCSSTVAILTLHESKPVIKNIPLSGIVHFHKRIPKPHFNVDNTMANNQTNVIPLPETKYRHPLFGVNYKKAIKVPKDIAQRLNCSEHKTIADNTEKRKKKKKKHKKESSTSDNELDAKVEPEPLVIHHKKKKHKHSKDNEAPSKLAKVLKHDPDSAETWESEKAIEQQLFSF